jgi:hypothetical protein
MIDTSRRSFLFGAGVAFVAAPAIVRVAAHLMPVSTNALAPYPYSVDDLAFLEGMGQTIEQTIWYGNPDVLPVRYSGFA